MTNPTIQKAIQDELASIEEQQNVHIFYACESGSRAWGFESQDSDYDVRFLYIHPTDWYLTIDQKRDVIEKPINDELDISGWDIRKSLTLLKKSNPPFLEWMQSPIIYKENPEITSLIKAVMTEYYSPISCMYHYLHMAQGNYREYLKDDVVWVKKYLYVLRPVLACIWIERDMGLVPIEFQTLVDSIVDDAELRNAIGDLLERKKAGKEIDRGPKIPVISNFIDEQLNRLSAENAKPPSKMGVEKLNDVFQQALISSWCNIIK
jgi:predicted nucleotidyltransferase